MAEIFKHSMQPTDSRVSLFKSGLRNFDNANTFKTFTDETSPQANKSTIKKRSSFGNRISRFTSAGMNQKKYSLFHCFKIKILQLLVSRSIARQLCCTLENYLTKIFLLLPARQPSNRTTFNFFRSRFHESFLRKKKQRSY